MALAPLSLTEQARAATSLPPSNVPLNLTLAWASEQARPQWLAILAASVLLHIFIFFVAIQLPSFIATDQPERRVIVRRTPLYLPPDVLTQRAPNRHEISKSIDLADLLSPENRQPQQAAPRPSRKQFEVPKQMIPQPTAKLAPRILPEAPKVALNQAPGPLPPGASTGLPAPPAPPPPAPSPFQNVGAEAPVSPHPPLAPPKSNVQAAINGLAQSPASRRLIISDDNASEPMPGMPGSVGQASAHHAAIELKSDPQGADLKPYLTRILAIVRANWRRVIPESARMGTLRGRTVMEFVVNRDGSIPHIVTADASGSEPLDRAALAGLSMSNPLPPLPLDYKGLQVRLAFSFSYNMPSR